MVRQTPEKANVQSKPIIERHIQTVLLALVIAAIGWSGTTTMRLNENSARQDERVMHLINLTEQLRQDLRSLDSQYITRREAEMHRNEFRSRVDILESRLKRVEDDLP